MSRMSRSRGRGAGGLARAASSGRAPDA